MNPSTDGYGAISSGSSENSQHDQPTAAPVHRRCGLRRLLWILVLPSAIAPLVPAQDSYYRKPDWRVRGDQPGDDLGRRVNSAGDVDHDGVEDVLVSSPGHDSGTLTNNGRISFYRGSMAGLETVPSWIVDGDHSNAGMGASAASAGDVNGDGYDDVIVGSPGYHS